MAVLDVLNINLGTEQNPNWVLHDLHDKRISTNAVTTATHLLATNAGVTAMNPITVANLAPVLGVDKNYGSLLANIDLNTLVDDTRALYAGGANVSNKPFGDSNNNEFFLVVKKLTQGFSSPRIIQEAFYNIGRSPNKDYYLFRTATVTDGTPLWSAWTRCDNFGCNTPADLASLLGVDGITISSLTKQVDGQGTHVLFSVDMYKRNFLIVTERGSGKYATGIVWNKSTSQYGTTIMISNDGLVLSGSSTTGIWVENTSPNTTLDCMLIVY